MAVPDDFKIKLNQNLWALVITLAALGASEHFCLKTLYWISTILSILVSLSVVITLAFYTRNYCRQKVDKAQ